jgi:uncharacterized membrane protein SpoIIM required for sporulation/ABC-type transport system involved in multi-copper enzyme maturation permease subunit
MDMQSFLNNLRPALIVTKREIRDQLRDWRIIFPIIALTLFFPFMMNFVARQALDFVQRYGANIIGDRLVPFFLMIVGFFPISVSLVIALETFVGEKERGSIEPLLNSPLKDWQLYLGKLISSIVPTLVASFIGMGVYIIGLMIQGLQLPELGLLILIIALTIVQALVMVSGAVVVSTQATSVRAANLLASFIIIPVALLIQVESVAMFWGSYATLWLLVFGMAVLVALLVRVGLAHFQREELLGREIDILNLRWAWKIFKRAFLNDARSVIDWYLHKLPLTIRKLGQPSFFMIAILMIAIWIGSMQVNLFSGSLGKNNPVQMDANLQSLVSSWPLFSFPPVLAIWWQNVRAMLISIVLGVFSFGILGVMPAIATFGILGFLLSVIAQNGISIWVYLLGFILPHGILEIPAVIIAGAAVLQMGAILATPTPGRTIGEVWIETLADWCKVMVGVVIPLLFVAAAIEAWVTPRIALLLVH